MKLALDWTQILSVIMAAAVIFYELKEFRAYPESRFWVIPIMIWMVLTIIFYAALTLDQAKIIDIPISFTNLSAVLRLYGLITLAGVEVTRHYVHKITRDKK